MSGVAEPLIQASLLGEAIDHGPVAVFVADDDLRYIAVNEFACTLLGYSREELLSLRVTDVLAPGEAAEDAFDLAAGRPRGGESSLLRKDGAPVRIAYRTSETTVAGMRFSVAIGWPTPPE
ncbi:MAG: PAS domain-containing protein [Actinomycetota bacterium]|nr:PAS domain-containing protein [Actinomycetota bacterium]